MNRITLLWIAAAFCLAEGFAKSTPFIIELGAALAIIAMITKPKTET